MPVVPLRQESKDQDHFYVPQYEIKIAGANLPQDVVRDVMRVTYKDSITDIDSFELTVNNWDPKTNDFKFVGAETAKSLKENPLHRLFDPSNKTVEIWMGYAGHLRLMLNGYFTTLEPNFPSGGRPTLTVRGLNVLQQLRPKQYTTTWENKTDSEIAEAIAKRTDPQTGKKRFPLPIVTNDTAKGKEKSIPYVAQRNQYDVDFLLARARRRGYVVFVLEATKNARGVEGQRRLYFGPSHEKLPIARDVTFELKRGLSLMDFKPTLTTANQIRSATVNGFNRATREPIRETVTLQDAVPNLNRDLHDMLETADARAEEVVDEPMYTPAQARERATAILRERHKQMVKANATCVGLPDLRAGRRVQIADVGARFSGLYFVTDSTHTIGDSGYTMSFNARREDPGKKSNP